MGFLATDIWNHFYIAFQLYLIIKLRTVISQVSKEAKVRGFSESYPE